MLAPSFLQGLKPIDFIGVIGILRLRSGQARSRALLQSPRDGVYFAACKARVKQHVNLKFVALAAWLMPRPFKAGTKGKPLPCPRVCVVVDLFQLCGGQLGISLGC